MFNGNKTYEQILDLIKPLNATIPQSCHNAKALVRYMAHLDNPDKIQYNKSDIIGHGGVDVAELLKPSSSQRYVLIKEMLQYVENDKVIEIQDLINYAMQYRFDDWFPLLCDNSAYIVAQYIKSQRHRQRLENVDYETGEILK